MYSYDAAGNRTAEQIDDQITGASYDALNRLVSQQPSGPVVVAGLVSEESAVTVLGRALPVSSSTGAFEGRAPIPAGTSTLGISATDNSGNTTTQQYEIDSLGVPRTFTYDANGNLTFDGLRSFEWDARNRLAALAIGTQRTEFAYDGSGKAVRVTEKSGTTITSETIRLWCRDTICEERSPANVVVGSFHAHGYNTNGVSTFVTRTHVGSVFDLVDESGTAQARFDYDPYGRQTAIGGTTAVFGFTGHRVLGSTNLLQTRHRMFDPDLGRWLTEDPARFVDGPNLYAYVGNDPVGRFDPLGLESCKGCCPEQKVSIWNCTRPVDAWYGMFLTHSYICCGGANKNCFGHANNDLKIGDPIPPENKPDGECTEKKVCPKEREAKCNGPRSPCNASTLRWNCTSWANWDGGPTSCGR